LISLLEGHPDNASAAVLGGFAVARFCPEKNEYLGTQTFPVSDELAFVVVAPELEIKTDDSRTELLEHIEFPKVVSSLNSLAYLVAAFASGKYDALKVCRVDHLHEPRRMANIPHGRESIQAGIDSGAYTGWLSGSGSSLLCVTTQPNADLVKEAMESVFKDHALAYSSFIMEADNAGALIEN